MGWRSAGVEGEDEDRGMVLRTWLCLFFLDGPRVYGRFFVENMTV